MPYVLRSAMKYKECVKGEQKNLIRRGGSSLMVLVIMVVGYSSKTKVSEQQIYNVGVIRYSWKNKIKLISLLKKQ